MTDAAGREAETPSKLGSRGWKEVLRRVRSESTRDHLSMIAGGVAYYWFLALFPALAAVISVYGLVADPESAAAQIESLASSAPGDVQKLLTEQVQRLTGADSALSWGLVLTLLLTLWSANKGMKGLLSALNVAYDEPDDTRFVAGNAKSFLLTVLSIVGVVLLLAVLVGLPLLLGFIGLGPVAELAIRVLRWPLVAALLLIGLAVIYRFGPNRKSAKWRWVSPGSVAATLLWLAASFAFAIYASNFGNYNAAYGSLGAVAMLLLWLYLSAYVVLLGAELNAEAEHQTRKDSTSGPPREMGERGAYAADNLA
jgi:membrane protein